MFIVFLRLPRSLRTHHQLKLQPSHTSYILQPSNNKPWHYTFQHQTKQNWSTETWPFNLHFLFANPHPTISVHSPFFTRVNHKITSPLLLMIKTFMPPWLEGCPLSSEYWTNTHTEQWAFICSSTQSCVHLIIHLQFLQVLRLEPTTYGLQVKLFSISHNFNS